MAALSFFINGTEINDPYPDPEMTLLYYLRKKLHLTGSKLGCGEGGCGACTVMVSKIDETGNTCHYSLNACLTPVCSIHGMAITTIEGIGSINKGLHPCQERIAKAHGSQCGFCTPGFVMSMYTLLRNNPRPSQSEMEHAFEGNLCRCTGYRSILDGYKTFCSDYSCGGSNDAQCCRNKLFNEQEFIPYPTNNDKDYIYPPKLKEAPPPPLNITGGRVSWYQPATLEELVKLRNTHPLLDATKGAPQYRLVVGNTEIGVETRLKKCFYPVLIHPSRVRELYVLENRKEGLLVGACVSLSELEKKLRESISNSPLYKTRVLQAFVEMLRWFAGPQIRNTACIGGNIATASPISDFLPILIACEAKVVTVSWDEENESIVQRCFKMDPSFVTGYRKIALQPNEIILSILLPYTTEKEYVMAYKQSKRREDDIAIVNSCFKVVLSDLGHVEQCSLVFGGMSYKTLSASKTEKLLIGKSLTDDNVLSLCCSSLVDELVLDPTVPGGMASYRLSLVLSFFYKFYLTVTNEITMGGIQSTELTAIKSFKHQITSSSQGFQRVRDSQQLSTDPMGQPMMGVASLKQASGEARYVDDIPRYENELYAGLILSERAHAKFTLDTSKVKDIEGVVDIVTASDVPSSNKTGIGGDELVFADGEVTSVGQIIAVVLTKDKLIAQRAIRSVIVEYEDLPAVLTIEDAIRENKFDKVVRTIKRGDVAMGFSQSYHICEGSMRTGAQEHFYLETNACIAVPKGEDGEMEIIASTQHVDGTQVMAATALGIPANRVVCRVKRIGGGFGGKETRSFNLTTAIAVAANKCGVPVRVMMDRNEDIVYSGARHPFLGRYKAGFTEEGKLTALELNLYSNTGYSRDLAIGVLDRALAHFTNAYSVPNVHLTGKICQTNLPSSTAFRGFGAPQAMLIAEDIMDRAAYEMGIDPLQLRYMNLLRNDDVLSYGVLVNDCHMTSCWDTIMDTSNYKQRRAQIDEYNKNHKWSKRGLAVIPTAYGIAFGLPLLNQGGALLHVYKDGSVLLTHGGIEIGQGLHTKVIQVCSHCLGIPTDRIYISETASDKVPNSSPTAASVSTDIYGAAVKDACDQIMDRLKPYREKHSEKSWNELIAMAYTDRVNLSAQGFYKIPDLDYDWNTGRGRMYSYYCYGIGCSEVELDTLSGGFKIIRSDLLMDVGDSINPAIDIGQVEGAFTQGLGLFTMEEVVYLNNGRMFTNGPGNYKIPSCGDIPIELNVSLMDRTPNPKAIFSSKAVGEPPLFLAASVFFAIKDAIRSSRSERGFSPVFDLLAPATVEKIRMACEDQFTDMVNSKMKEKFSDRANDSWSITP